MEPRQPVAKQEGGGCTRLSEPVKGTR